MDKKLDVEQKKDEADEAEKQGDITSAEIRGSAKIPAKRQKGKEATPINVSQL